MNRERAKELLPVIEHFANGGEVEVEQIIGISWMLADTPVFRDNNKYRIKVKTKDSIDWSHVAPEFKWMARDDDGLVFLYTAKPHSNGDCWTGAGWSTRGFISYKKGAIDWKDSLITRPEDE